MERQLEVETTLAQGDLQPAPAPSLLERNPRLRGRAVGGLRGVGLEFSRTAFVTDEWDVLAHRIALAASHVVLGWPNSWPAEVLVIALGVPGNIAVKHRYNYLHTLDSYRQRFLSIPRLAIATHLPRSTRARRGIRLLRHAGVDAPWRQVGADPPPVAAAHPGDVTSWTTQLAGRPSTPLTSAACRALMLPTDVKVETGTRITIDAPVGVSAHSGSGKQARPVPLAAFGRPTTFESVWPLDATITPGTRGQAATVCPPPGLKHQDPRPTA